MEAPACQAGLCPEGKRKAARTRHSRDHRDSGAYLLKFAWTKITRHTLVKGWASPDDPALTGYWATRRHRGRPPLDRAIELVLDGAARCVAASAEASTVHREGGHAVSQFGHQLFGDGVVLERTVYQDEWGPSPSTQTASGIPSVD